MLLVEISVSRAFLSECCLRELFREGDWNTVFEVNTGYTARGQSVEFAKPDCRLIQFGHQGQEQLLSLFSGP